MVDVDRRVMRSVRAVAREAMADGARAVVLMGSYATGDAHAHSDVDVVVIGRGPADTLMQRAGLLLSVSWTTRATCAKDLRAPAFAGTFVPGWRAAIIIDDPHGIAAGLQRRAIAFRWDAVAASCDAWVAEQITGYAEEIHKLVGAMEQRHSHMAAVQRSVVALSLPQIISVHHRILHGTENVQWDLVAARMDEPWASAQARAFGERGESLSMSCRAALELYGIAAREVWRLLDRRQRAVVGHACELAAAAR